MESHVVSEILAYLSTRPDVRAWRVSVGVAKAGNRVIRFGIPGMADISGIISTPSPGSSSTPSGRRLEIECKAPRGRLSPAQISFRDMIVRFGGLHVVARSAEDVRRALGG